MKKIFIIICLILVIISGFLICCTNKQKEKISALKSSISELKKEILISTFVITQKTDSEISMKIRLFDYGGKEICTFPVKIPGTQIYFDTELVNYEEKGYYLAFPSKIYSDKVPPAGGISLYEFYTGKENFPLNYSNSPFDSDEEKDFITRIFDSVKQGKNINSKSFGSSVHEPVFLPGFIINQPYSVIYRPLKGGIELMEAGF